MSVPVLLPEGCRRIAACDYNGGANLALQGDGKLFVGGGFDVINGATRQGLVRLNGDPRKKKGK